MFEVAPPVALGVLELLHPTWPNGSVAQGVAAAGGWWVLLHVLLIAGYALVAFCLWRVVPDRPRPERRAAHLSLLAFVACNTLFLAIDGLAIGRLAATDPASADALWNSLAVEILANATGATWALTLLLVAATLHLAAATLDPAADSLHPAAATLDPAADSLHPAARTPTPVDIARRAPRLTPMLIAGLALTWLTFVASTFLPGAALANRAAALATGAWAVFTAGASAVPFALLVFAAVLHQHVGPEAALGMLCIALALALLRPRRA